MYGKRYENNRKAIQRRKQREENANTRRSPCYAGSADGMSVQEISLCCSTGSFIALFCHVAIQSSCVVFELPHGHTMLCKLLSFACLDVSPCAVTWALTNRNVVDNDHGYLIYVALLFVWNWIWQDFVFIFISHYCQAVFISSGKQLLLWGPRKQE